MLRLFLSLALAVTLTGQARFDDQGRLLFPDDYREWVYMSSGLGMNYFTAPNAPPDSPFFDNVFVGPGSFGKFKETGVWPEGTVFVLEIRYSQTKGALTKSGFFQSDVASLEAAVKDTKRFPKGWGYFTFGGGTSPLRNAAEALPANSSCQACHEASGAVEQTFSQFYPTALAVAVQKKTVRAGFKPLPITPAGVFHQLNEADSGAALALEALRAESWNDVALREQNLNQVGYGLLQAGKKRQAVEVFRWVATMNNSSANAQDSLADALESAGEIKEAIAVTERALALLPNDPKIGDQQRKLVKAACDSRLARLRKN